MKKILLAGTALLTAISGSAMAADMRPAPGPAPVYTKAPMMAPLFTWTGCYVGGNVGGLFAKKDWSTAGFADSSLSVTSWLAGGQIGCNYQVSTWVFGIQGDYDWSNANGTSADAIAGGGLALSDRTTVKSLASVTGRVGYAWDRFLGYVKGGGAWVKDNYETDFLVGGVFGTASETRTGWTIGVGGEYAFTDWLTGFVEYDYYNFGTKTNSFATIIPSVVAIDIKESESVVKGGINFKFGGWH